MKLKIFEMRIKQYNSLQKELIVSILKIIEIIIKKCGGNFNEIKIKFLKILYFFLISFNK